jgi:hypothetical protein
MRPAYLRAPPDVEALPAQGPQTLAIIQHFGKPGSQAKVNSDWQKPPNLGACSHFID